RPGLFAQEAAMSTGTNVHYLAKLQAKRGELNAQIAALARKTGLDLEDAQLLYRYRNRNGPDIHWLALGTLQDHEYQYCEALEQELGKQAAQRAVRGGNTGGNGQWKDSAHGRAEQPTEPRTKITATPYVWHDPTEIEPRDFLYGNHIVRGYVSATVSMGGVGKTSEVQVEVTEMVTGRDLLGVKPREPLRVWYINLEDPLEEIERRFAAIFKHYEITKDDIGNRLFIDSGRKTADQPTRSFIVARDGKNGIELDHTVFAEINETIKANAIDVVVVDPLVNSAHFPENDNSKMAQIIEEVWAAIPQRQKCAVELEHPVRKGPSGGRNDGYTVEDARGAGALINSCR